MQQKNRRRVFGTSLSIENREAVNLYGAITSWILHRLFLSSLWASCRRPTLKQLFARRLPEEQMQNMVPDRTAQAVVPPRAEAFAVRDRSALRLERSGS